MPPPHCTEVRHHLRALPGTPGIGTVYFHRGEKQTCEMGSFCSVYADVFRVWAHSVWRHNTCRWPVVVFTEETTVVPPAMRAVMDAYGIDAIRVRTKLSDASPSAVKWLGPLDVKILGPLNATRFARLILLDLDLILVENVDALFMMPRSIHVAMRAGTGGGVNSGVVVITPPALDFAATLDAIRMHCDPGQWDQQCWNRVLMLSRGPQVNRSELSVFRLDNGSAPLHEWGESPSCEVRTSPLLCWAALPFEFNGGIRHCLTTPPSRVRTFHVLHWPGRRKPWWHYTDRNDSLPTRVWWAYYDEACSKAVCALDAAAAQTHLLARMLSNGTRGLVEPPEDGMWAAWIASGLVLKARPDYCAFNTVREPECRRVGCIEENWCIGSRLPERLAAVLVPFR